MPHGEPTLTNELPEKTGGQTSGRTSVQTIRKTSRRGAWKAIWKRTLARWRGEPPEIDLDYFNGHDEVCCPVEPGPLNADLAIIWPRNKP